jgi:hypothetical protein
MSLAEALNVAPQPETRKAAEAIRRENANIASLVTELCRRCDILDRVEISLSSADVAAAKAYDRRSLDSLKDAIQEFSPEAKTRLAGILTDLIPVLRRR